MASDKEIWFDLDSMLHECEDTNAFRICWWSSLQDNQIRYKSVKLDMYSISCLQKFTKETLISFFLLQIFWILKNGYKRNPNHKLERHSAKTWKTEFVYWTLWLGTGNTFIFMIINFNFQMGKCSKYVRHKRLFYITVGVGTRESWLFCCKLIQIIGNMV